jgi:hypothetical protein
MFLLLIVFGWSKKEIREPEGISAQKVARSRAEDKGP